MKHDILIFDLDGTISDPKEGIVKSFNYALAHGGLPELPEQKIAKYIGPPLDKTFIALTGNHDPQFIADLVARYRERYADIGYSENRLYDGVKDTLLTLHNQKIHMGICTSKPAVFAKQILTLFGLDGLFEFINGGDVGIEKWQQLQDLRQRFTISQHSLMIGDRAVDLTAARKNGLQSAGVLWGYGSSKELETEHPAYMFETPAQWLQLIQ
ncbi:HAD hydrolase-like protein [Photobacterium sp. WH24]|uniref:HAD hydrolase-like protein n=1 Tax=Photobacterium arenosum TaxID=2774143 RepID=A0ABR9BID3_9GAMM|nr:MULTISPECIES: HAD hydrolase-like protein [Photobacterium]MBD8511460.1 HAD hydrolase-like protein [Photobacterium arenosum]MBV7263910.1 HAD hydrolase-like protein [Photobacterium sp. WH24]